MYHILFGFDDNDTVKAVIRAVKKQTKQSEIDYSVQTTKDGISEYLHYQNNVDTIVLREVMEADSWSAEELAELNDWKTYNIIVVIDKKHKGTDYCTTLYTGGITNAYLVDPNEGVPAALIAHFIINPRSRAAARKEYGMDSVKVPVNVLTSDLYLKKYAYLIDDTQGANLIDRYLIIVRDLTVKNAVSFTEKLPSNIRNKLMEYEEFWKIIDHFISCGFKVGLKKPKHLRRGMTPEAFRVLMKKQTKKVRVSVPREYMPIKDNEAIADDPPAATETAEQDDYFSNLINVFEDTIPSVSKTESQPSPMAQTTGQEQPANTQQSAVASQKVVKTQPVQKVAAPPMPKTGQTVKQVSKKPVKKGVSKAKAVNNKEPAPKVKARINWKFVLGSLVVSVLVLTIFYFTLGMF